MFDINNYRMYEAQSSLSEDRYYLQLLQFSYSYGDIKIVKKTIIKFTNHKFVQTDCCHLESSVYMWDVRTASSFKDPLAVESYNRGALERHRKENELSGLGDEKGPRDYVYSLIVLCIGRLSHSRHHGTVDRMDVGFMQTIFTSDSLTSCLYCLSSLNLGFLICKMDFLKEGVSHHYEITFFSLVIFFVLNSTLISIQPHLLPFRLQVCISISIILFSICLCLS